MIPYYEKKWQYLNWHQKGRCPIAWEKDGEIVMLHELHHAGIHDTKLNRKRWPLLIDSLLNLKLVNHNYHMMWPSWGRISDLEADRKERFLERHPKICEFVNTVGAKGAG